MSEAAKEVEKTETEKPEIKEVEEKPVEVTVDEGGCCKGYSDGRNPQQYRSDRSIGSYRRAEIYSPSTANTYCDAEEAQQGGSTDCSGEGLPDRM